MRQGVGWLNRLIRHITRDVCLKLGGLPLARRANAFFQRRCFLRYACKDRLLLGLIGSIAVFWIAQAALPWGEYPTWRGIVFVPAFTVGILVTVVLVIRERWKSIRDMCNAGRNLYEMDLTLEKLMCSLAGLAGTNAKPRSCKALNQFTLLVARYEAHVVYIQSLLQDIMSMRQKREEISGLVAAWFDMLHLRTQLSLLVLEGRYKVQEPKLQGLLDLAKKCRQTARLFADTIRDGKMIIRTGKTKQKTADPRDGRLARPAGL